MFLFTFNYFLIISIKFIYNLYLHLTMERLTLLKKLEGVQTIESIMDILNVNRQKAIYYVYTLRKKGYVKSRQLSNKIRVYNISFANRLKGTSYYDIINEYSPTKIVVPQTYKIYGKKPSLEETLIYAIKTKSLRIILASLALFKRINDWGNLYRLAKENHVERQVGALYDLSRTIMRTRRMISRFSTNALPKLSYSFSYTVPLLKSKDFKNIENKWRIYLPFNKKDLEAYK